ncbi:MAG: hypothetical protein ACRCZI_04735 [Cetobacterium sp.]
MTDNSLTNLNLDGNHYYMTENNINTTLRRSIDMNNQEIIIEEIPNLENLEIRTPVVIEPVKYTLFEKTSINNYFQDVQDVKDQLKNLKVDLESKDKKLDDLKVDHNKKLDDLKVDHDKKLDDLKVDHDKKLDKMLDNMSLLLSSKTIITLAEMIKHAFGTQFKKSKNQKKKDKQHAKKHNTRIHDPVFDNKIDTFINSLNEDDKNSIIKYASEISEESHNSHQNCFRIIVSNIIGDRNMQHAHFNTLIELKIEMDNVAEIFNNNPSLKVRNKKEYLIVKNKEAFLNAFFGE